jgi:membrane glycosyltransferase
LLGLALAAYVRRGSRSYLLVVGAFVALLARSVVAGLTMTGVLPASGHHLLEHGLDVVLVALVVAAVYHARTVTREVDPQP